MIPLYYTTENDSIINYAFFSESRAMKQLRLMPFVEVAFVLLFVLFGVYAILFFKRNEKDILWVGMAKEMAHQLGTPISSLLGWIDVLSNRVESSSKDSDLKKLVQFMENDVEQLRKVGNRFGKIGSEIELKPVILHDLIQESVDYYKERLPHLTHKIDIIFISKIQNIKVNVDPDLIKWAIENLIKNAIDAMQKKGGSIILIAFQDKNKTHIIVQDEGKGIAKSMQTKIFEPGVSTKSRGWGLGLSLAKRIVEDFYKGKIHVIHSVVDEGSTIEISIPEK
jgi:signal transduction histidine kinase